MNSSSEFTRNFEILVFKIFFKSITTKLSVLSPGKCLRIMWNLITQSYPEFVNSVPS